ncbi:MAG: orotate phosphoribosyltransferase [Polyangiales bacterium]
MLALLTERSYRKRDVGLASGKTSDFFVDCKQTVLLAEGHALVGAQMLDALARLPGEPVTAVAGVELGGCPLASAVSLTSFERARSSGGRALDAIYVRKAAKDHGSQRLTEGDAHLPAGTRVAILEDVITTGGSTLRAVESLRAQGHVVAGVIVLVDRQEGGRAAIEAAGLPVVAVFVRSDFPR